MDEEEGALVGEPEPEEEEDGPLCVCGGGWLPAEAPEGAGEVGGDDI